jgi:hypothetical protein
MPQDAEFELFDGIFYVLRKLSEGFEGVRPFALGIMGLR